MSKRALEIRAEPVKCTHWGLLVGEHATKILVRTPLVVIEIVAVFFIVDV
jgi:hypothetical protein